MLGGDVLALNKQGIREFQTNIIARRVVIEKPAIDRDGLIEVSGLLQNAGFDEGEVGCR